MIINQHKISSPSTHGNHQTITQIPKSRNLLIPPLKLRIRNSQLCILTYEYPIKKIQKSLQKSPRNQMLILIQFPTLLQLCPRTIIYQISRTLQILLTSTRIFQKFILRTPIQTNGLQKISCPH